MNEFELLAAFRARLDAKSERVLVGSGDDAAVVRPAGALTVTSVDAFVEGVHFRLATTSMRDLGHKVLAAALSDLAAMGAQPGEAYVTLGVPDHLGERELLELTDGAHALASRYSVSIAGGDFTRADELFVAVTVVGYADAAQDPVTRAGAGLDDVVGVTGALGGAAAGLLLLERKPAGIDVQVAERLLDRQLRPRPLIETGRALAAAGVTAMIDVSDGVASDTQRLCEQSAVRIDIDLDALPADEGVAEVAARVGLDPLELVAGGGEDYELLFTAPPDAQDAIERAATASGSPVTQIGRVVGGDSSRDEALRLLDAAGRPRRFAGWDHLRAGRAPTDRPERA